jgi:hypothetical protein
MPIVALVRSAKQVLVSAEIAAQMPIAPMVRCASKTSVQLVQLIRTVKPVRSAKRMPVAQVVAKTMIVGQISSVTWLLSFASDVPKMPIVRGAQSAKITSVPNAPAILIAMQDNYV